MRDTMANIYKKRLSDWRNGAIVYQVLVDRFNPSKRLEEKMALYQYPKKLNDWQTLPKPGKFFKRCEILVSRTRLLGWRLNELNGKIRLY